jgi:hypothetical protein
MVRGLYAPQLQVAYTCPSGSCAWPSFDSLGFCSTCEDVTDTVEVTCGDCKLDIPLSGSIGRYSTAMCNYTTPGGINATVMLKTIDNVTVTSDTLISIMVNDLGSMTGNASAQRGISMDEHGGLATLDAMRFDQEYELDKSFAGFVCGRSANQSASYVRPKAYSCTLGWCVNTYPNTTFGAGSLDDAPSLQRNISIAAGQCVLPSNELASSSRYLCPVYPAGQPAPPLSVLADPDTALTGQGYWINDAVTSNLQAYLQDTFNFGIGVNGDYNNLVNSPALQQTFYTANNGNISLTMQGIAKSLSNEVRQGPESRRVNGTVAYSTAYVQIRWPWIAYLASLAGFSTAFLIACVVQAARDDAPVWKSSLLGLLLHVSNDESLRPRSKISDNDYRSMEAIAKKVYMQCFGDQLHCGGDET